MSVIALDAVRKRRTLQALTDQWLERLDDEPPSAEVLGWNPVLRDPDGNVVRWIQPRYRAFIGPVSGKPGLSYVDYGSERLAYRLTVDELAVGLETGILPRPVDEG